MNKPEREGFVAEEPVDLEQTPDLPIADLPEWPLVIKLRHKPIKKSEIDVLGELSFREPTAFDLIKCGGNPCRLEVSEMLAGNRVVYSWTIDDNKMMRLMANLCGVLEPQLQRMDPRDYATCAYKLRYFFIPDEM